MNKQFYSIQLEDYSLKSVLPLTKTYYGTLNQIGVVIDCLAADPDTAARYASTIGAYKEYKKGHLGVTHTIAGKRMRLLTPVNLVHETIILEQNVEWYFNNGVYQYPVRADFVDLHQVLLNDGDMYLRCVRPCYEGLRFDDPYEGWTNVPACHYGFPYIYKAEPGWHYMRLYTLEQVEMTAEPCLVRMHDARHVSHHEACNDLFGGHRDEKN